MYRELPMFYYLTTVDTFSYIATANTNFQNKAEID
jgi:hypothetical protein